MAKDTGKQYIYIVQASLETAKCKIGKTNDLERRLKKYNSMTGKSKDNVYQYLFTCEVSNMAEVENAVKENFPHLREENSREIYFYNSRLFSDYVGFIKSHKRFVKEVFIKPEEKTRVVKIVKTTTPSLEYRKRTRKDVMQQAKTAGNDEFYTRYEDIEKELSMYPKSIWKNKTVFCNCDDPVDNEERNTSAFALYFIHHFQDFALAKLICTHYSGPVDLFHQGPKAYVFRKTGYQEQKEYPAHFSGSFDDPLSIKILKEEADIVCTNPPFSRAIDYWELIIKSRKKFIIVSNISNAVNTAFIPYFMRNKVWAGYNRIDYFLSPKMALVEASGHWYTNIPIKNRPKHKHLKLMPLKEIPDKHKKYDDAKTLLVDGCYIPDDYQKPFAVSARPILNGLLEKGFKIVQEKRYVPRVNGKEKFARALVQKA